MENRNFKRILLGGILFFCQVSIGIAQFEPDTSLNNKIFLLNSKSVKEQLGDLMPSLNRKKDLPDIYVSNKNGSQYLRLIFHPGSFKNSFSMFEIGYISKSIRVSKTLDFKEFKTERSIKLGISKSLFLSILGKKVHELKIKNVYTYKLNNPNDPFLLMYNLPSYWAEYTFKNNKLIKFIFGFEYP